MAEDNIAVAIRVRPIIKTERKQQLQEQWDVCGNEIRLKDQQHLYRDEPFTFDYILGTSSSNEDLYNVVQPLVHSTLNGFNATIFAYGQTSSGKTHSILGSDKDPGIIPRSAQDIFTVIGVNETCKYMVRVCYVEIYNEKINDLLDVQNKDLKIRVGDDGKGAVLVGMHEEIVHNEQEMMAIIQKGNKNRQIGETRMNERSSRSHVICDILIESSALDECEDGEVEANTPVKAGHLYIVDLAGSERIAQTGATGQRLNEGVHINKSLSVLISVITQLSNGSVFVSYRDSKLTRLLNNALGGNSRTLIVAAITPVSVEDSLSTLKFARSAKTIKTKPKLNELMSTQSIIKRQQSREKELLQDLNEKGDLIRKLTEELVECRNLYVPPREIRKPKQPARRHTMGIPTDRMTPIMECDEEPKTIRKDSMPCRQSEDDLKPSDTTDVKYENLVVQYNHLDESHASLVEFNRLQFETAVQAEVAEFQRRVQELEQENAKYREDFISLRENYDFLEMSHVGLTEFTKTEIEIAANERCRQLEEQISKLKKQGLPEECDKLRERLTVMEAERELVLNSQNSQHQRRCDELLTRIRELETTSVQMQSDNVSDSVECTQAKTQLDSLQEKCDKLEVSIKLAEKHSKILLAENNALKGFKMELKRSVSDSNLTAIDARCSEEEYTKEDFQRIFKSLRRLTSTIISGNDDENQGTTPFKTPMSPMPHGRVRSKSEKPSFVDRISLGMQEEENEELKKENAMHKEHINELLAKLKTLNDKMSARDIANENAATYEERIKRLQEENSKLREQDGVVPSDEIKMDDETYLRQLEDKVKQLESDMKECEVLVEGHQEAQSKIEQLTLELNEFKNQNTRNDSLPNQNSKFIEELQEKLKVGNEFIFEKDLCIKQLQEEHQAAIDKVKLLEENISKLNVHSNENKTDMAAQQQIDDLELKIVDIEGVVQEKEDVLKRKEEEVAKLEEKLKQERHDHDMDKEALEYSSSELDEAMAKIKGQQAEIKALKCEHTERIAELLNELESYKCTKSVAEAESAKLDALSAELATAKEILEQKDAQIQEYQEQLNALIEEQVKLTKLEKEFDDLMQVKENASDEVLKLQSQLAQNEETLSQLQETLIAVIKELEESKMAAEGKLDLQREVESMRMHTVELKDTITALQKEIKDNNVNQGVECNEVKRVAELAQQQQQQEINTMKLTIEGLKTHQAENIEELVKLQSVLEEKESKLGELQVELDSIKQESHQNKMAAVLQQQVHQEEIQILEFKVDELTAKNEELVNVEATLGEHVKFLAELQEKLEETKQSWANDKKAANAATEEHKREIECANQTLHKLTHEIKALQEQIDTAQTQGDNKHEQLIEIHAIISKKDEALKELSAQCEQLLMECQQHKMGADTLQKQFLLLKESQAQELEARNAKILFLTQEIERVEVLQREINELNAELANHKNMHQSVQEQLDAALKEKENIIKIHEAQVQAHSTEEVQTLTLTNQLEGELEACVCKLRTLEETLQQTQEDYKTSLDTIRKHEEEITSLKTMPEVAMLNEKYEQAVAKINLLNTKLQTAKKYDSMLEQIDKEDANVQQSLSCLPDEKKIQILSEELHKKRIELQLLREQHSYLKKDYQVSLKEKNELHAKLEAVTSEIKAKQNNKLLAAVAKKNAIKAEQHVKDLEDRLKESALNLKHAEETIVTLRDEAKDTVSKILTLEKSLQKYEKLRGEYEQYLVNNQNSLKADRKNELEVTQWQKKYEGLKSEYEQYLVNNHNSLKAEKRYELENSQLQEQYERLKSQYAQHQVNNQNSLNIDNKEIVELRNELLVLQQTHERQIAAMTEDCERKYRGYSDKYAMLKKLKETKEARIFELEARLEQSNKENHQNQSPTGVNSLSEANKVDAKRKIIDLQQQLQIARQECQSKAVCYEKQIIKLQEDYQKKLSAMQCKLDEEKTHSGLPTMQDLAAAKEKERFARLVDAELFTIPAKLRMINKVASCNLQPNACAMCSRVQLHIVELRSKCMEHSTWREFQLDLDSHSERKDRQIETDRFTLLTETRDIYVRLLQLAANKETSDLIKRRLGRTTREIEEHMKMLSSQEVFLKFLHEELKTAGASISNEHKNVSSTCEQCPLFRVCYDAIIALVERIKFSVVIIEGLGNKLNPLQFCVNNVKSSDELLEKLMSKLEELQTQVTNQKELDIFKEKYKRAKRLADVRYQDVQLMAGILKEENYTINYKANPIQIIKMTAQEVFALEDDNPRPFMGRSRDSGRKSLGATPKHFSPFFVTPDEHKVAKHEARRHK